MGCYKHLSRNECIWRLLPIQNKTTIPRLREINWSNSLFKNKWNENTMKNGNISSKPSHPQMVPVPVTIENDAKIAVDKVLIQKGRPKMRMRHSESFKMLPMMNQWNNEEKVDDEKYQYLQISYKSIQIQIKCQKGTKVQTINKSILMDGYKVLDVQNGIMPKDEVKIIEDEEERP